MDFRSRYQYDPKTDFIAKGGFARVFKAYDNVLDRQVALKVYSQEASSKYDLIADMKRGSRLDHPNLCRYFDVAVLKGVTAMGEEETLQVGVMEYLDGGNIKQYIDTHPKYLTKLLLDVLQGLSYLHQNGIIHRDLTPSNILVKTSASGPVAKITDFGISKVVDSATTKSSELLGKVEYMAPEQFNPQRYGIDGKINYNLDLWSFGCLVYELIKGESLFGNRQDLGTEQVIMKILDDIDKTKVSALPEPFSTAVEKCLIKDAKQRIKNAEELIEIISGKVLHSQVGLAKEHKDSEKHNQKRSEKESEKTLIVKGVQTNIIYDQKNKNENIIDESKVVNEIIDENGMEGKIQTPKTPFDKNNKKGSYWVLGILNFLFLFIIFIVYLKKHSSKNEDYSSFDNIADPYYTTADTATTVDTTSLLGDTSIYGSY